MSTVTTTPEASPFAPVGWARRPDGGKFFTPGKRHLYDAGIDLEEIGRLRTICGTEVPKEILRGLRGVRVPTTFAAVQKMDGRELDAADPCKRCAKKASE